MNALDTFPAAARTVPTVVVPFPELAHRLSPSDARVLVRDGTTEPRIEDASYVVVPHAGLDAMLRAIHDSEDVRVVQVLSAGTEHVASRLPDRVRLVAASDLHAGPVAELALSLVLGVLNRVDERVGARTWGERRPRPGLSGRSVLVVGAGAIGSRVAALVAAFGARPTVIGRTARHGVEGIDRLGEVLPAAEVLVLAVPLTAATRGLIGARELALLPDGALVVNVARGAILDTDAITREVASGRLRAALDVVDPEPLPDEHPLWRAPGALIVPHLGGKTADFHERAVAYLHRQVADHLAGRPLRGEVDRTAP